MNEERIVRRYCVDCGEWFDVYLTGKPHWWMKRKIDQERSDGVFFGYVELGRVMRRRWMRGEEINGQLQMVYIHPWWKRILLKIQWRIEDFLDPPEITEYWECNKCHQEVSVIERESTAASTAEI